MNLIDILTERRERQEKYFKNYLDYVKRIKKEAENLLGEVKVFIFGSILRKDEVPRDIDVLVISSKLEKTAKKSEIRAKIWQRLGFLSPFEIHLITPEEYQDWYKNFIKEKIEVK